MKINRSHHLTLIVLIVALLAPFASWAEVVDPGVLQIDLGLSHPTFFGISPTVLGADLCGLPPPTGDTKDPKLLAANDGTPLGRNVLDLVIAGAEEIGGGTVVETMVQGTEFVLVGPDPLVTPCGEWTYRARLDAGAVQPVSTLTLHRSAPTDTAGVFLGSVELVALLEFTEVDTAAVQVRPLSLTLDLQGSWASAPSSARPPRGGRQAPAAPATNLVLFTGVDGGLYVPLSTPNVQRAEEFGGNGQLVLQASDLSLAALNGW